MTGLGKWICSVNTIFFSGDVKFEIFDNDGEYGFRIEIPDIKAPEIIVKDVEEDDDTITVTAETSLLPGKDVVLFLEFDEDGVMIEESGDYDGDMLLLGDIVLSLEKCRLTAYSHGKYYELSKPLQSLGFAVKKKHKGAKAGGRSAK